MKKNFLLSLIIILFSFISFSSFLLETYFLHDKLDAFYFLLIAFTYVFIFSMIVSLIISKMFKNMSFYKEISVSFLIIMVILLIINLLEMSLLKSSLDIEGNKLLYFIVSILSSIRVTLLFSIPIYFISNLLEFVKNRLFKGELKYESI